MNIDQSLLEEVIAITYETGKFIREESLNFNRDRVEEKKGFSDLVSYVDKTAELQLVSGLSKLIPDSGFIAEEGTGVEKEGYNWIVDPLDGTTNFIHGLPVYSISIALFDGTKLVLGVVYEIARDECFSAILNGGAFLNGKKISVSDEPKLEGSLLATGFPYYEFDKMSNYLSIIEKLMRSTHGLRRMGSAAVDLAYTACGRFEGYFEFNLNAWDIAAGALIVKEAGGTVSNFSGGDNFLFEREIIAAGSVYAQLLETIKERW